MHKLILLSLACALLACTDGSGTKADAGGPTADGMAAQPGALERAPGSLARPPGKQLPDDLKPPGYAK